MSLLSEAKKINVGVKEIHSINHDEIELAIGWAFYEVQTKQVKKIMKMTDWQTRGFIVKALREACRRGYLVKKK